MTKSELLSKVSQTPDERQLLARVCDQMDHANRGVPASTPFLSAAQQRGRLNKNPPTRPTPKGGGGVCW